jgi:hypothetical protein
MCCTGEDDAAAAVVAAAAAAAATVEVNLHSFMQKWKTYGIMLHSRFNVTL